MYFILAGYNNNKKNIQESNEHDWSRYLITGWNEMKLIRYGDPLFRVLGSQFKRDDLSLIFPWLWSYLTLDGSHVLVLSVSGWFTLFWTFGSFSCHYDHVVCFFLQMRGVSPIGCFITFTVSNSWPSGHAGRRGYQFGRGAEWMMGKWNLRTSKKSSVLCDAVVFETLSVSRHGFYSRTEFWHRCFKNCDRQSYACRANAENAWLLIQHRMTSSLPIRQWATAAVNNSGVDFQIKTVRSTLVLRTTHCDLTAVDIHLNKLPYLSPWICVEYWQKMFVQ